MNLGPALDGFPVTAETEYQYGEVLLQRSVVRTKTRTRPGWKPGVCWQ